MTRLLWLPDVLRDAGLVVRVTPGWETRGYEFNREIFGTVGHHTASNRNGGNNPSLFTCIHGRPDLRGPLSQLLLARDGSYDVIASGIANHGGAGSYPGWPLSVNNTCIATEAENDGIGELWSSRIMDSYAMGQAAILEYLHKDESKFIAHFEWGENLNGTKGRKIDPRGPWEQGGRGEDWWSGNLDVNRRSAAAFRMRIGACMGMTVAQEQKLDKVLKLLDDYFGIDAQGHAKDIRLKIDDSYVELKDENHSDTLGGRLVAVEEKVDKVLNILASQ
jgi:hypothetical protein